MEIREATAEDFEDIVRLVPSREELFLVYPKGTHPFSVDQLRALAEVRKELTVAVHDGEVIAFADLYDVQQGRWPSSAMSSSLGIAVGKESGVHWSRT